MQIKVGYDITYEVPVPTPMVLTLNIHSSRAYDIIIPDRLTTFPSVHISSYRDGFGNWCNRVVAPTGMFRIASTGVVSDSGRPDSAVPHAPQHPVEELPDEALVFLLGSRYCETDRMSQIAWDLFGNTPMGWGRVQAICDYVHNHIAFGYQHAHHTKTAWDAYNQRLGVCRDFTHLAITFCRAMNIPARYCTGYLGDIGMPPPYAVMDFAAWFEAYLGGRWHMFDPRNNIPRIGRVLIARGRDAADVAITTTFGPHLLRSFNVFTDEIMPESVDEPAGWPAGLTPPSPGRENSLAR